MNHIQIIEQVYNALSTKIAQGEIPISLRAPTLVGTVQDDPFDCWVADTIKSALPNVEVFQAGKIDYPRSGIATQGE